MTSEDEGGTFQEQTFAEGWRFGSHGLRKASSSLKPWTEEKLQNPDQRPAGGAVDLWAWPRRTQYMILRFLNWILHLMRSPWRKSKIGATRWRWSHHHYCLSCDWWASFSPWRRWLSESNIKIRGINAVLVEEHSTGELPHQIFLIYSVILFQVIHQQHPPIDHHHACGPHGVSTVLLILLPHVKVSSMVTSCWRNRDSFQKMSRLFFDWICFTSGPRTILYSQ